MIGVLSAVLGAGVGVTTATVASAYATTGCKYAKSAISPITYRFYSVSDTNEYAVKSAVSAWNATSAPGSFGERSTLADPELNVTDDTYTKNAYAWVSYACGSNGTYSGGETNFVFNNRLSNGRTTAQRKRIAVHELGHSYGLGHVSTGCRIMRTDIGYLTDCTMTTPQADDIAGVKALYK